MRERRKHEVLGRGAGMLRVARLYRPQRVVRADAQGDYEVKPNEHGLPPIPALLVKPGCSVSGRRGFRSRGQRPLIRFIPETGSALSCRIEAGQDRGQTDKAGQTRGRAGQGRADIEPGIIGRNQTGCDFDPAGFADHDSVWPHRGLTDGPDENRQGIGPTTLFPCRRTSGHRRAGPEHSGPTIWRFAGDSGRRRMLLSLVQPCPAQPNLVQLNLVQDVRLASNRNHARSSA